MIGYVILGTNRLNEAATFYDGLFASIGASRTHESELFIAWSKTPNAPAISITLPLTSAILMATS